MQYSRPAVSLPRPEAFHQQYQEYHPPLPPPVSLQQPEPQQQQQQPRQPGLCPALRDHSSCPYPQHYNPHNSQTNYHVGQSSNRNHNAYPFDPVYHSSGASLPWPSPTQLPYHSWSPNRPLGNRSSFPPTTRQSVPQPYSANVNQSTSRGVVTTNSTSSTSGQVAAPPPTSSQAQSVRDQPQSSPSREQSASQSAPQYQQGPRFGEMPPALTDVASLTSRLSQRTLDVSRAYATSNVGPPSTASTRPTGSINLPALGSMNYVTPRLPHQPSRQYGGRFDYRVDAAASTIDRQTGSPRASTSTSEPSNLPAATSAASSDSDSDEESSEHALRVAAELDSSGSTSDDIAAARIRAEQVLRGQLSTCKRVASRKALASLESVELESLPKSERLCMICYNDFGVASPEGINEAPLRLPKCKHVFGDHCIKKWFAESDSCPYCRDKLPSVMQHPLGDARVRVYLANLGHLARQPPYNHRRSADVTRLPAALQSTGNTSSAATLAMLRTMGAVEVGRTTTTGDRRLLPSDVVEARRRARFRVDNTREAETGSGSDMLSNGRPRSFMAATGVRFGFAAPSQTLPQSHTQTQSQPQVQGAIQTRAQHQQPPVQGHDSYPIETYHGPSQQASSSHSRQISLAPNFAFAMSERPSRPQFLPESFPSGPISDVRMTDSPRIEQSYMMDLDSEMPPTNMNGHRAPFASQPGYMGWG